MIVEIICQVTVVGENFDCSAVIFPNTISIIQNVRKGDIVNFGRNKGKMSEEGLLIFNGDIDIVLQFLEIELIPKFLNTINELNISILVSYEDQCNFELTVNQLTKISALKIPLGITCYNPNSSKSERS
jgi:hypothetical protein